MLKIVPESHVGILWQNGKIVRELPAGKHRYFLLMGQRIDVIDTRLTQLQTGSEEYATKDHLMVRCSITIDYRISDATLLARSTADQHEYMRTQAASQLRIAIGSLSLDELLEKGDELRVPIEGKLKKSFEKIGLTLEAVAPLNIFIPRSLRQAFEAEVAAKKRALADLEEARGRTAVLRHLANAAAQVEQHPALFQLLMGQKAKHVQFQFTADDKSKK